MDSKPAEPLNEGVVKTIIEECPFMKYGMEISTEEVALVKKIEPLMTELLESYIEVEYLGLLDLKEHSQVNKLYANTLKGFGLLLGATSKEQVSSSTIEARICQGFAEELGLKMNDSGLFVYGDETKTWSMIKRAVSYSLGLLVMNRFPEIKEKVDSTQWNPFSKEGYEFHNIIGILLREKFYDGSYPSEGSTEETEINPMLENIVMNAVDRAMGKASIKEAVEDEEKPEDKVVGNLLGKITLLTGDSVENKDQSLATENLEEFPHPPPDMLGFDQQGAKLPEKETEKEKGLMRRPSENPLVEIANASTEGIEQNNSDVRLLTCNPLREINASSEKSETIRVQGGTITVALRSSSTIGGPNGPARGTVTGGLRRSDS